MSAQRIVCDVGGTNVRFALGDEAGHLSLHSAQACAAYPAFDDALRDYLRTHDLSTSLACVVAAAGPIVDEAVKLTNNPWTISRADLAASLGHERIALINDLEAVAAALPHLGADDTMVLGAPPADPRTTQSRIAINVGTGFGAALAIFRGARWWTCASEAGHMSLAPAGDARADLTIESVLSGLGIGTLYAQCAHEAGAPARLTSAEAIFSAAGQDPIAAQALSRFTRLFGRIAGDLVLAGAAWGGAYLCGSVARHWARIADIDAFRASFIAKGALRARMERVPVLAITREDVALFGMAKLKLDA